MDVAWPRPRSPAKHLMRGYQRHIVSEHLCDRYPYLEDINSHLKSTDVSMAFGDRLFPRLVDQLKDEAMSADKLVEALSVICDLCSHQENKCQATTADVVAAATNLLMHDCLKVRREAARVVASVALMIGGRSCMPMGNSKMPVKIAGVIAAGPTLPRLAKLLIGCNDELVRMHTAEAMQAVTIFRDGCQQAVDQGMVKVIAQYLCATLPDLPPSKPLALCLNHLLRTLAAVTIYAIDGMRDIFGVGLVGKVVTVLGRMPKDGLGVISKAESMEIVRQGLRMLWHCGNDARGRKEMLKANAVRILTDYLQSDDGKVRETAVCALNVISLETQGKDEVLRHSIESLARLLHSNVESAYLHETCVQLIRCAAELPAFRYAFAEHNINSIWLLEKIFGTAALATISPLLRPGRTEATRFQAVHVVRHFLTHPQPAVGDEIRVPPVRPSIVEDPALFALEECTGIMPNLLSLLPLLTEPVFDCLDALTDVEMGKEEMREILDDNRAGVSSDLLSRLHSLVQKRAPVEADACEEHASEETVEPAKPQARNRSKVVSVVSRCHTPGNNLGDL